MAWCRTGLLATGSIGTSFSNIWMKNKNVLFTKMHLQILSLKWRTFSSSLNMLRGRFLSINYDRTKADERKKMFANGLWSHILNHIKRLLSFIHQWCGKNLWNVSRYVPNVASIPLMCRCLEDKDGLRQVFEFMLNCLLAPTKQCRKTMKLQKRYSVREKLLSLLTISQRLCCIFCFNTHTVAKIAPPCKSKKYELIIFFHGILNIWWVWYHYYYISLKTTIGRVSVGDYWPATEWGYVLLRTMYTNHTLL